MKKKIITGILTVCIALSLCACGQKEQVSSGTTELSPQEAREAIKDKQPTLSQLLGDGRTLWYHALTRNVTKDGEISAFYIFENKKVTYYRETGGVTFGDLDGLSDDEIIKLIDDRAKKVYEEGANNQIANDESLRDEFKEIITAGTSKYDEVYLDGMDDNLKTIEECITILEGMKNYQSPEPVDYQLRLETDSTGNNTAKESITNIYTSVSFGNYLELPKVNTYEETISLVGASGTFTIYNTELTGYVIDESWVLLTKTDNANTTFLLDAPEDVETD